MEKGFEKAEGTPKVKRAETRIPDELLEKQDLSLSAKVILGKVLGLWKNCGEVYISNDRLSRLLGGISVRTVQRAKLELKGLGLITISQEEKGKGYPAYITVDEPKVNDYLGFEYFKKDEKKAATPKTTNKETTTQVSNKTIGKDTVVDDPLAFMNTDYYRKAREEAARQHGETNNQ